MFWSFDQSRFTRNETLRYIRHLNFAPDFCFHKLKLDIKYMLYEYMYYTYYVFMVLLINIDTTHNTTYESPFILTSWCWHFGYNLVYNCHMSWTKLTESTLWKWKDKTEEEEWISERAGTSLQYPLVRTAGSESKRVTGSCSVTSLGFHSAPLREQT